METKKMLLKTCENCNNYGVGMYNFPCCDCDYDHSMCYWTPIKEFPTKELKEHIKKK